jgi:hypothetical protein
MITPMNMQDTINDFLLEKVVPHFNLKSKDRNGNVSFKKPQVIRSGWVLPKSVDDEESNETEEFPYIITRIEKIENIKGTKASVATLMFLYGVYDPGVYDENGNLADDGSGYRDCWNLIEATRQAIFMYQTIENKYMVDDDFFEAKMLDEQIYPYWEGYCKMQFNVMFPVPKLDDIFFTKGD